MDQLGISLAEVSLGVLLLGLALTQLGLPIPETPLIVSVGIVCQRMGLWLPWPILACSTAVLVGDLALYALARKLGRTAFRRRPLRWVLPEAAQPRVDALFLKHGSLALFIARFITGVRVCVFVLAGWRRVPVSRFVLWDGLAIVLTVPLFAALGHAFGHSVSDLNAWVRATNQMLLGLCVAVSVAYLGYTLLSARHRSKLAAQSAAHLTSPPAEPEVRQASGGCGGDSNGS